MLNIEVNKYKKSHQSLRWLGGKRVKLLLNDEDANFFPRQWRHQPGLRRAPGVIYPSYLVIAVGGYADKRSGDRTPSSWEVGYYVREILEPIPSSHKMRVNHSDADAETKALHFWCLFLYCLPWNCLCWSGSDLQVHSVKDGVVQLWDAVLCCLCIMKSWRSASPHLMQLN